MNEMDEQGAGDGQQGRDPSGPPPNVAQGNRWQHPQNPQHAQQGQYPPYPYYSQYPPYPQQWPPQPRRNRRLPVLLGILGLAVLTVTGSVAWGIEQHPGSTSAAKSATPMTTPASVAAAVTPGLVDVNTVLGLQGARAAGTGIVLTSDGEVLTNHHVVQGATRIQVTDLGNGRTYRATVAGFDSTHDIAVLRLQGASGLSTATIGDSSSVAVGNHVIGIGNAGGVGGTPSVAPGTVTALDQSITATDEAGENSEQLSGLIEVAANIQAGDSGGPLVNAAGQVIGVDTAGSGGSNGPGNSMSTGSGSGSGNGSAGASGGPGAGPDTGGDGRGGQAATVQGFAIPINQAVAIADQIEAGQTSATVHIGGSALLGVSVVDSGALGMAQGTTGAPGAVVGQVVPGTGAAAAGLTAGDVIVAFGGHQVDTATTLTNLLDQHHPGDEVSVTWIDEAQQQQTATVRLTPGPVR
jgi:S1-C subfamily serine protease